MAGIDLQTAEAQLAEYLAAETRILARQSYTIGGRQMTFANLAEVRAGIKLWDQRVQVLAARASGRGRSRSMMPSW